MSEPLGPVMIGPREIYDAVLRLQGTVDRLADRQDVAQREADERYREIRAEQADHESRMRSLERGRWPLPALSAAMSLVALVLVVLPILTGSAPRH